MNEMQIFDNSEFGSVRTLVVKGERWFVGKDVATALGYSNTSKAVSTHVDDEDKQFFMLDIADSQNGNVLIGKSRTLVINESGLYCLILSSKLPSAKKFKRWVTSEVLPALRKSGSYTVPDAMTERPLTRDDYLNAARILAGCRNERLPIVVTMLDKAGLDMEEVRNQKLEETDKDPKISSLEQEKLRAALAKHTDTYVAKQVSLSRSLISFYRRGVQIPHKSRYRFIMSVLGEEA